MSLELTVTGLAGAYPAKVEAKVRLADIGAATWNVATNLATIEEYIHHAVKSVVPANAAAALNSTTGNTTASVHVAVTINDSTPIALYARPWVAGQEPMITVQLVFPPPEFTTIELLVSRDMNIAQLKEKYLFQEGSRIIANMQLYFNNQAVVDYQTLRLLGVGDRDTLYFG